jgi:hypothetical protein
MVVYENGMSRYCEYQSESAAEILKGLASVRALRIAEGAFCGEPARAHESASLAMQAIVRALSFSSLIRNAKRLALILLS